MSGVVRVTLASLDENAMKDLYGKMQEQAFHLRESSSGMLKGSVNMSEAGPVFFSIPYDKGWKVLVDGKRNRCKVHWKCISMWMYLEENMRLSLNTARKDLKKASS